MRAIDFYKRVEENGNLDILRRVSYVTPEFYNWGCVQRFLTEVFSSCRRTRTITKRVLVYGDYDVDGAMCAKIMLDGLNSVGVDNVEVFRYQNRTHQLDRLAVQQCIQGQYEYLVVCDTGSSDLILLEKIASLGTKILVLDHHVTSLSYDDFDSNNIAIINTVLENSLIEQDMWNDSCQNDGNFRRNYALSAGALCYVVLRKFFEERELEWDRSIVSYAAISLFSDCMDMSNRLNRAIYYEACRLNRAMLPPLVRLFMNDYNSFCARYVGFWFSPRMNAMFRSENFELLNMLLFDTLTPVDEHFCCDELERIYSECREMVKEVADVIRVDEMENFVLGDLYSVDRYYNVSENHLANYTGLVANKLAEEYGKTAVVFCKDNSVFKGSVRDPFGRNYLVLFQQICHAAGHASAFGLMIRPFDFDDFISNLKRIDSQFSINTISNEPIIVTIGNEEPDTVLIEDMALYNEFSGQNVPTVYIKKLVIGSMREQKTYYNYKYRWGKYLIQSENRLNFGTYTLLRPTKGLKTKLIVQ